MGCSLHELSGAALAASPTHRGRRAAPWRHQGAARRGFRKRRCSSGGAGGHLGVEPRGALGQREIAERVVGGGDEQHRRGDARHRPDRVVRGELGRHAHQRAVLPAALRRAPAARERLGAVSLGTAVSLCTPCACRRTLNQQCLYELQLRGSTPPSHPKQNAWQAASSLACVPLRQCTAYAGQSMRLPAQLSQDDKQQHTLQRRDCPCPLRRPV